MEPKELGSGVIPFTVGAGGCLAWSACKTAAEQSAGLSSEQSNLMAALMLPSSIFEVTARERSSELFLNLVGHTVALVVTLPAILSLINLLLLIYYYYYFIALGSI